MSRKAGAQTIDESTSAGGKPARLDPWDRALRPLLIVFSVLVVVVAVASLQWDLWFDVVHMEYVTFLIQEVGKVPYEQVFDPNMPGTYLFHILMSSLVGYSTLGVRIFDVLFLGLIAGMTSFALGSFDWRCRWLGAVLFPFLYLSLGEWVTLQRDYFLLAPIIAALWMVFRAEWLSSRPVVRWLLIGSFVGWAISVKPQVGLFLILFAAAEVVQRGWQGSEALTLRGLAIPFLRCFVVMGFGATASVGVGLVWVAWRGGFPAFVDIVQNWWPIHTKLNFKGGQYIVHGTSEALQMRFDWVRQQIQSGGPMKYLLVLAVVALARCLAPSNGGAWQRQRLQILVCGGGVAILSFTTFTVGQEQPYVFVPVFYFVSLLVATTAHRFQGEDWRDTRRAMASSALLVVLALTVFRLPSSFVAQAMGGSPPPYKFGRVPEMAEYLRENLRPGEKVQVIDWFGGATAAALEARADNATRYYVDYQFFLSPADPYVKGLQQDFLRTIADDPPQLFLVITNGRNSYVYYDAVEEEAARSFQRTLDEFLRNHYRLASEGFGYRILERLES